MNLPADYLERVYAGVLGKMIGVYLGRPFESWTYNRIQKELGEINGYVHHRLDLPLVVTDDDLSGTFTFIRALEDNDYSPQTTAAQMGTAWLNYLVENKTILSWSGLGCSTENTAYLRLKQGIPAPQSGSTALNGPIVSQQIGGQIFIDGCGLISPGNPEQAADLARRAASVSHDGEAIIAAQVIAIMEAQAFIESDRFKLIDTALKMISHDSNTYKMISELLEVYTHQKDWHTARQWIEDYYGYAKYPGGCHVVPNHALILLGLLYGNDDFQHSLMITNTSGWDTDCNSGNLGCLLGIKLGLDGIDHSPVDWRGPVADRLYLPSTDGGNAISDAVTQSVYLTNIARRWAGLPILAPKQGSRYHFTLPGCVQGWQSQNGDNLNPVHLSNKNNSSGESALEIRVEHLAAGHTAHAAVETFLMPASRKMTGYPLLASPTIYPGQVLSAQISASPGNETPLIARLYLMIYGPNDLPVQVDGPDFNLNPGQATELTWRIPDTDGAPIFELGLQIESIGTLYLDYLTWDGEPTFEFCRTGSHTPGASQLRYPGPELWREAWIMAVDHWERWSGKPYRLVQNEGLGFLIQGCRSWSNYHFSANVLPAFGKGCGIAARVQGLRRYYALLLRSGGSIALIKARDGDTILAECKIPWQNWQAVDLSLQVETTRTGAAQLHAWLGDTLLFDIIDENQPLASGAVALIVEEGHMLANDVRIRPIYAAS